MSRKPEASWDMKMTIWDLAAKQGDRPEVILRDLQRLSTNKEMMEELPDSRTVRKIIDEYQSLKVAVLKTLPPHTWHLREDWEDIRAKLGEVSKSEPAQSEEHDKSQSMQPDAFTVKRIEKHHRDMLQLVERCSEGLTTPAWEHPVGNVDKSGILWNQRNLLEWHVHDDGTIHLVSPLDRYDSGETKILREYLYQHLRSSEYAWILSEVGVEQWKADGGRELYKRAELLNRIELAVKEQTGLLPAGKGTEPGPTQRFSHTIWAVAVNRVYVNLQYKTEPKPGGYIAQYGDLNIAVGRTKEEAEDYCKIHKEMMVTFEKDNLVQDLTVLKSRRESVTKAIQEALIKMVVDGHIPGTCSGCPGQR